MSNVGDSTSTAAAAAAASTSTSSTVDLFEIALTNTSDPESALFVTNLNRDLPVQVAAVDSGPSDHYGIRITDEQSGDIKLRNLFPQDIPELKEVCGQWFPIEYPNFWYEDITSNKKFCSLVATHQSRIIGLIVADVKLKKSMDEEDRYLLARKFPEATQLAYILSLGVLKEYRRLGIASLLLDTLIHHLNVQTNCKAVYLHVLSSNTGAIKFYEKRAFERRAHLAKYYTINGKAHDGYTYVLYMNGGEAPLLLSDLLAKSWSKVKALCNCDMAGRFYIYMVDFFGQSLSRTKDQYRIS